ncbi:aldo/keto reductase [Arthrobacter sp. 24S4-2]|uniref:aldo/keto reductase n=1 Tax=Arthrobacter sp. 24S4-2 TaxID=2575374 RepID=UPI0010C7726E|nr:aldo/keto reductase [Arthrobacter sp. 24S4-2]QCP00065.1 aldo/keto reductase [Arthrobacter sp. 24S4-2]
MTELTMNTLRTGVRISNLGLGASQFGNLNRLTTDQASTEAVARAYELGLRYFDTAPHYGLGLSELRLGAALQALDRDDIAVSTKVGRLLLDSPETADRLDDEGFLVPAARKRVWDFSRDGILRSVEESLQRLQVDTLAIAYLHDPDDHWEQASTTGINTLIELRDQGVVRSIGVGMNQADMLCEFIRNTDIDVVMIAGRLTLLDQSATTELLPLAQSRGVGIVAAGVYNSGLLSSVTVKDGANFDYAPASDAMTARARRIAATCQAHGLSLPDAALQYPLRHPSVLSVVVGTRSTSHVDSSLERFLTPIPDELWAELDATGLVPDLNGTP